MRTVPDLLKRLFDLRSMYSERDARYEANWLAYKGEYDRIFANYSSDPLAISKRRQERHIQKWNLVRPIVDTHKILLNVLPTIEVPAPVLGESLAALKADKMEKVLYALWDMTRMGRTHGEAAFNIALNFATVWQAVWDEELDIPSIVTRNPGETYPVMKRNGREVAYCFFRWEEDSESLAEKYPDIKPLLTSKRIGYQGSFPVEVIEYVDDQERGFIIGGEYKSVLKEGKNHKLGLCPVIITAGAYIPGEVFPPGPIDQIIAPNDYLNRFQTMFHDAMEENMFGHHVVKGEGANDVPINTGPGQVIRLEGTNLDYAYEQPQAPAPQYFAVIDQVQRYMRNIANWPEVASGEMDGSIVTGKAVSRLQGIMQAQAAESQQNMGDDLARMNGIMLKMMETYRPNKRYDLYATEAITALSAPGRPKNFGVSVIPSEDFQGYYHNLLHYSPFGSDINQSIQIGMQLVDARIWSRSHLRNLIPGTSDAEGEQAEIEEEDRRRMQLEVDLQVQAQERILQAQTQQQAQLAQLQAGQSQVMGGTGAEASAPQGENAPLPEGGLPPTQSPAGEAIAGNTVLMPSGQPQMMGVGEPMTGTEGFPIDYTPLKPYGPALAELAGTGVHGAGATEQALGGPEGEALPGRDTVSADDVISAITSASNRKGEKAIDKLKGQVYLLGEIAQRGWTDGNIEIGVTVKSDQQIITNALPEWAAQRRLTFRVVSPNNLPPEAMPVAGSAQTQAA